eukprot:COSAG05_NODE_370_length_10716_cov_5.748422_9_plen_184_part_00
MRCGSILLQTSSGSTDLTPVLEGQVEALAAEILVTRQPSSKLDPAALAIMSSLGMLVDVLVTAKGATVIRKGAKITSGLPDCTGARGKELLAAEVLLPSLAKLIDATNVMAVKIGLGLHLLRTMDTIVLVLGGELTVVYHTFGIIPEHTPESDVTWQARHQSWQSSSGRSCSSSSARPVSTPS